MTDTIPTAATSAVSGPVRLSAMLGIGVFAALSPAVSVAGRWAIAGVPLAGVLALCAGRVTPDPARPDLAGRIAGGLVLAGYLSAAAAVASAFGAYAVSGMSQPPLVGTLGVLLLVATAAVAGLRLPRVVTVVALVFLLVALVAVVGVCLGIEPAEIYDPMQLVHGVPGADDPSGIVVAAGVLAAGLVSGRTLSPGRPGLLLLLVATGVVTAVAAGTLRQLGGPRLAVAGTPLRSALAAADASTLEPLVTAAAGIGAVTALWLLLGAVRDSVLRITPAGGRSALPVVVGCLLAGTAAVLLPHGQPTAVAGCLLLLGFAIELATRATAGEGGRALPVLGFGLCLFGGATLAVSFPVALAIGGVVTIIAVASRRLAPG